jgi:uncharacterized cupredoxin-like copper-binding protein
MIHVGISTRVALSTTAVAFSAALVLTACSSGSSSSSSGGGGGASSSSAAGSATGGAGAGNKVTVTETEYSLKLSQNSFKPGTYTFTVDNAGKITHALEIEGPGLSDTKTQNLQSGAMQPLTVTLKKGTYEMYCPVPGHKQLGMDTHITVA